MSVNTRRWVHAAFVVAALLTLAGLAGVAAADGSDHSVSQTDTSLADMHIQECAATPPDDFSDPEGDTSEVIGWVEGYWYNEPLDIDIEDGLNQEELDELAARTAARFEAMRCLTADSVPPVEILTREEFEEENAETFETIGDDERRFDNAQMQTLLAVDTETDAVDLRQANRAATVGGFYNFAENRIVVVSDDPEALRIDEEVLAHELGHAIQDQQFNLSRYNRTIHDVDSGKLGLIEGDVDRVEFQYLQACEEGAWDEPCIQEEFDDGPASEPASWTLYFMNFQPYSDGPAAIEHVYERGGWEAVDDLYDDPPRTSTEVIYPEKINEFEPADLSVPDRSNDDWDRLTTDGPDYNVIGQAGITAPFMEIPYVAGDPGAGVISQREFLNLDGQDEVESFNPLNYEHSITDGWRGDRLYAYTNEDNTGSVWKTAWDDGDEAENYVDAYEQLAEFRGGQQHDEFANVYTFEEADDWDMTVAVDIRDDRVWIVTAPTVDDLTAVHDDIELLDADEEMAGDDDERATDDTADTDTADDADADGPGFGVVAAVTGLLAAALLARRAQR